MPRKAKGFPRLTTARAKRAVGWATSLLKLDDYEFFLWIQDDAPRWCGTVGWNTDGQAETLIVHKVARIWISPSRVADGGDDPLETVLHEVVHVLFRDAGIIRGRGAGDTHVHGAVYRLGEALAKAYRAGVKV